MDAPRSKPPRVADPPKLRTVNRFCSRSTTSKCTPATTASPKLEELKLAFCLLAREIQGSDGDENENGASTYTPATTNVPGGGGKGGERVSESSGTGTNFAAAAPPEATEPAPTTPTAAAAAVAATAAVGAVAVQLGAPSSFPLPGVPEVSVPTDKVTGTANATSSIAVYPETENPLPTTKAQLISHHCSDAGNLERVQAAPRAVGQNNATEGTARGAKQALKRLQAELEAERRSRTAAESALRELQQQADESDLKRERNLAGAAGSFGVGRPLEERPTAGSERVFERVERRAREAEGALAASQQLAEAKAREAAEALEQAAGLLAALEKERAARATAVNARRIVTLDLRACLRGRAKAEEEAASAAAALKKSEAARESLAQRLEVLRAANKRLEQRTTAAAVVGSAAAGATVGVAVGSSSSNGGGDGGGGHGATDTGDRLAIARARLRTLSAGNLNGGTGNPGGQAGGCGDRAAIDRALVNVAADKKWKGKLRQLEVQRESYKSAAQTAEMGMQQAVREKAELEGVNRSLARRLAAISDNELAVSGKNGWRRRTTATEPIVARDGETPAGVGVQEAFLTSNGARLARADHDNSQKEGAKSSSSSSSNAGRGTCSAFNPTPPFRSGGPSRAEKSWDLAGSGDAAVAVTGVLLTRSCRTREPDVSGERTASTVTGSTEQQEDGGYQHEEAQEPAAPPPRGFAPQAARSNSIDDTSGRASPRARCGDRQSRRRSASTGSASHRRHTAPSSRGREEVTGNDGDGGGDSCALYNRLLSESRQLREEVMSAVRRRPWLDGDQVGGGGTGGGSGGNGSGGVSCGESLAPRPRLQAHPPEETLQVACPPFVDGARSGVVVPPDSNAVTTVPIAVLLRLCERGARGVKCVDADYDSTGGGGGGEGGEGRGGGEEEGRGGGGREEGRGEAGWGGGGRGTMSIASKNAVVDDRTAGHANESGSSPRRAYYFEESTREAREKPEAEEAATTLPLGISPSLARQVQGAVSRGDERGFLQIVGRCGSATRGGIAQLLSIEAP